MQGNYFNTKYIIYFKTMNSFKLLLVETWTGREGSEKKNQDMYNYYYFLNILNCIIRCFFFVISFS